MLLWLTYTPLKFLIKLYILLHVAHTWCKLKSNVNYFPRGFNIYEYTRIVLNNCSKLFTVLRQGTPFRTYNTAEVIPNKTTKK